MVNKIIAGLFNLIQSLVILGILFYLGYTVGISIYKNWEKNEQIAVLRREIADLKEQNRLLSNRNMYYQTKTFAELEARKRLGMKKKGEKAMLVKLDKNAEQGKAVIKAQGEVKAEIENPEIIPNYIKWYWFVLGKKLEMDIGSDNQ